MKILLVTGTLAGDSIKHHLKGVDHEVEILSLPVTVAAFISPSYAASQLGGADLSGYNMILLPGSVEGDVSPVEDATGIPTFKGPLHASDLSLVLSLDVELSKTVPAALLIKEAIEKRAHDEITIVESNWRERFTSYGGLLVGGSLPISNGLPMRVLAEIVNAPTLSLVEIGLRAKYYESQGADLIDIGMMAGTPKPEIIPKIVDIIRESVDLPISIDTLNPEEIKSSIDAGIDLILSIDQGNLDKVAHHIGDEAVVILPSNMSEGYLPKNAEDRVSFLNEIIKDAIDVGINNIIGDLVVEPLLKPGLMEGLKAYQLFRQQNPKIPLLFGIGNAIELIDADNSGVIASLTALARETGSNMLHVPEHSVKAVRSVWNAKRASHMVFLAEQRGMIVKDLGIDLLQLNEKRWSEIPYSFDASSVKQLRGVGKTVYHPDETGWFDIHLDREKEEIVAVFFATGEKTPSIVVQGKDARVVYQTIIREKLITKLDHAAYLGKELEKAYIALKLGRSYVQDKPLF